MYNKIINPVTGKKVNTNSKLGRKLVNIYGGSSLETDEKNPHYIKNSECLQIMHKYTPLIKSGNNNLIQTLPEKIRLFYDYVFHIRKGLVNKHNSEIDYVFDNKIRCNLFVNKDIETPEKFNRKLNTFKTDLAESIKDLTMLKHGINEKILDIIHGLETITNGYQWVKAGHSVYAMHNEIEGYFELVKEHCYEIENYTDDMIENLNDLENTVEHKFKVLFNFSWQHNSPIVLMKLFYDTIKLIDTYYKNKDVEEFIQTQNIDLFFNEDNYADMVSMHIADIETIEKNDLTIEQIMEL